MKHINLTQMLQGCSKRNGMTVSASGSDGAQTSEVKRQTLSSKNEKWSKNEALHSTCLRSASVPLSYCPHYLSRIAVILCILVMSIANIGTAWGSIYKTYSLSDLAKSGLLYEKSGLSDNDRKLNKGERKVEVPCADASGTLYFNGTSAVGDRYASIWGSNGTSYDASRQVSMPSGYGAGISFTSADIMTEGGKYYIIFGARKPSDYDDFKIVGFKYVLNSECSASGRSFEPGEIVYIKDIKIDGDDCMKISGKDIWAVFVDEAGTSSDWAKGDLEKGSWDKEGAIYKMVVPARKNPAKKYVKIIFTRDDWKKQTVDLTTTEPNNLYNLSNNWSGGKLTGGSWGFYTPASKTVYFDNRNVSDWTTAYVRIGHGSWNNAWGAMTKVAGTRHLYTHSTSQWDNHTLFSIANTAGWTDGKNIYQPYEEGGNIKPDDGYKMSKQTNYQKYPIISDAYLCPSGTSVLERGCQYYKVNSSTSTSTFDNDNRLVPLPSYSVTYSGTNCSVTVVKYNNDAGSSTSDLSSGSTVDPTRIIKVTVTPHTGYQFSEVSVTGVGTITAAAAGTPGVYYVTDNATISATCTAKTCTVNFDKEGGSEGTNNVTATYGSAMPSIIAPTRTGYTFDGYWDGDNGTGTQYYNADGTSKQNWDKDVTANQTLYAKWNCITPDAPAAGKITATDGCSAGATFSADIADLPSYVTWYWQDAADGTSTSNPASIDYTTNTEAGSKTIYLRAKNTVCDTWSSAVSKTATVRTAVTAAWGTAPADGTVGGSKAASVTTNYSAGLRFSSSDATVASVHETSGAISYLKAGTTTITATVTGEDSYCSTASVNKSITVSEAVDCSGDPTALVSGTLYKAQDMKSACFNTVVGDYVYGLSANGKFYITGTTNGDDGSTGTVEIKGDSQKIDKIDFDSIAWLKGAGTGTCRSIKFVIPSGGGKLTVYGKGGGSKEGKGNVQIKESSTSIVTEVIAKSSTSACKSSEISVNAGTYYIYSSGASAAIYGLKFVAAPTTYSITYNCDGAESGCPSNVAAATNLPSPLPSGLTKTGYNFSAWYTNSEKTIPAAAGDALTENTNLYAKWTAKTTIITIDANTGNHGSTAPSSITATYGSELPSFTAATGVSGYSLTGYFTEATSGTKVINADGSLVAGTDYADASGNWKYETSTLTLYAQYEEEADACYEFAPTQTSGDIANDAIIATSTGGTMVKNGGTISYTTKGVYFQESSSSIVTITLDNNMQAGTEITAIFTNGESTKTGRGVKLCTTSSTDAVGDWKWNPSAADEEKEFSYTVTDKGTFDGTNVFRLIRQANVYLKSVTVTGCADAPVCTTPATAFANGAYTVGGSALDLSTLISGKQGSGTITYTVKNANGTGAAIAGTSFTATSAGTATVTATQAADATYCEKEMDATITVSAAPAGPSFTAPASVLDISSLTDVSAAALITAYNATQSHYLSTNTDTLLLIPSDIYYNIGNGKKITWAAADGTPETSSVDWSSPAGSVSFKGRSWWKLSSNINTIKVRSNRTLNIRVTGCKTVSVLNKAASSTKYFKMEAYEYSGGYVSADPAVSASNTETSVTETSLSLNASKEYVVVLYAATEDNNYAYEMKFIAPATPCTVAPTVSAGSNSSVASTTATVSCTGGITSLGTGGCTITSYGFVLNTTGTPTISDTKHQVGTSYTSTGVSFSKDLTGLTASTTYYVRPYATNGYGTAYGEQTNFTTEAAPAGGDCDMYVWFADPTTDNGGAANTDKFTTYPTASTSDMTGSFTIDEVTYSVTKRRQVGSGSTIAAFTVPANHTGIYYAIIGSTGTGTRTIYLKQGETTIQTMTDAVAGSSSTGSNVTIENIAPGSYTITANNGTNVGFMGLKLCDVEACSAPTITGQPTNSTDKTLGETVSFSLTATGADSYQWYRCNSSGDEMVVLSGETANSLSFTAAITGTTYYRCRALKDCGMSVLSNVVSVSVTPIEFTIHYTAGVVNGTTYTTENFTTSKEVNDAVETYIAESSLSKYTFTGVTFPAGANGQMSNQISMPAEYDANKYVSFTFDVASNYQIQLTNIDLQVRSSANTAENQNFKIVVSDAYGHLYTKESLSVADQSDKVQIGGDIDDATHFVGTVTVKLYGWTSDGKAYRINKDIYLTGEVSSLPAPTASWTARPASATVGDGGKTYTLTTDGTNTVAWSITDQSGAIGATLSEPSVLSTTLSGYTTAGSLYVQASVTGDGIHYLSTPATLLRQRVVISAGCVETTLISATLSSCTGTGAVSGTPGGTSTVSFESCESIDGGYKMGKDDSYMRLALRSGNFEANDEVKITITKASDQGDGALHIYKYADASWTELGSVTAAGAGTYSYTLTETNVSTAFNTIGLYRTGKNQNPYVKALSVVRNSCSATKPTSVTVTASADGPYAIGATPELRVSATNADTYQWYSNTNNTASDGFLLVGETETTYSPSTAIAGTTYYYCVATNTSGSTVSNIIEVTVNSAKSTPTVSWTDTYETPTYGGGGYAVKATVSDASWDGTLTTDMLTASDGVTLTGVSVEGKVITATYGVTETARSPLSFSLTLPETTNYTALAANKEITFTRCQADPEAVDAVTTLPVLSAYTTVNNIYRWETADAGWFTLETGASSISSESSSYSGFSYRSKSGKKYVLLYSELDAVKAVRLYVNGTGDNTTLSKVRTGTTYNKYKELEESTDYDFTYSNSSTSIASRENAYIEISFKTNLTANTFVEITLSRNTLYYGVELLTGSTEVGTIDTDISWATDPGTTVNKKTTDANFRYEAVKAPDAASQATLGTISYKSSVPAVATVSATGVVDVLSAGSTRITATLAGSGCYKKATLSYDLVVAAATCTDVAGTITASGEGITIDGNTVTKTDACAAVTLTVSGHTGEDDGATYQWYKDGVSMGESYRSKSIPVTANGDYTVEVTNDGGEHCTMPATNTITITGEAISITKIVDEWYVKNGRRTPDIALATIEGTTSYTVNDGSSDITTFAGCGFELRDGILYLKGQQENGDEPNGLTAGNATLTITAVNACGDDDPTATITIHKQVETDKPSIAFIVDGTKGDPVNNVATAKTSSRPIWIYLSEFFDLTGCNAYWTNNEKQIRQYYSQFDAIVITDDPSTDEKPKSGLKYVNALGTMVDVRPILTMEAYVGKYGASSNWHIGGTPSSPNPRQYELKLQCKDHDIFSDLTTSANFRSEEIDGETYYYVTMVDNSVTPYAGLADDTETGTYPALQGFSAASIKGTGLLGIGTISDGTLQGGVERQDEPTARMMILGIQHQAMAALTSEGKQVIKNAINYLLMTNMEDVNDCSNYFIGGTLGHEQDWHTASNWSSTKVPDASTKARILVPVTISTKVHVAQVDIAVGGRSIRYNSGGTNCSGRVTINPTGALIVDGQVRRTTNGRLYTEEELQPTENDDLIVKAATDAPHRQGALIFDNSDGDTHAVVEMWNPSYWVVEGGKKKKYWSYVAVPIQEADIPNFFWHGFTYLYDETSGWIKKGDGTSLYPFQGIGASLQDGNMETFYGPLATTESQDITLTYTADKGQGMNLIGNSWTAPIQIANFEKDDFGDAAAEVWVFNTGHTNDGHGDGTTTEAGQWNTIPINSAGLPGYEGLKVIPAMQAFEVNTTSETTLHLDYDRLVRAGRENLNEPMRAPRRSAAKQIEATMRVRVSGESTHTDVYLLKDARFSDGFDNGWDGHYLSGDDRSAQLYAISEEEGKLAFLAQPEIEGTQLGFAPSKHGNEYTFSFSYDGDEEYYLNDIKLQKSTQIDAENKYLFTYEEGDANRFFISRQPLGVPEVATGNDAVKEDIKAIKIIYNDKLYIIRAGRVYSAEGILVK